MARTRVVVVGADAAGMSAASQALRVAASRGRELEVVAFESTSHTSYSACGIPYWMAGDVGDADDLVARTAAEHRENGIDLRMRHAVTGLDLDRGEAHVRDLDGGREYSVGFDQVMLATGAQAVSPDWARDVPGVVTVKTLDDGATWRRLLDRGVDGTPPRRAVVVGGGYIGVEVAETFARRGLDTTLVTRGSEPMSTLEPELGRLIREALERLGVAVVCGAEVGSVLRTSGGELRAACVGGDEYAADVVALGIGVRPRTEIAQQAGLGVGVERGLLPDSTQQVRDGVWAAGDCCAVFDRVLRRSYYVPLGTHANKAGRVAGTNIGGGLPSGVPARFGGTVGTAITRVGDREIARTGILESWAHHHGIDSVTTTLESTTASGYMPEAEPITVRVLAERGTGRLLGCQIVGGQGAGKRIDIAATALWAEMTVGDVAGLDLAYAPPFSPTWDPVQIACRKLAESL